jgi:putative intracellular protease/amidase
VSHILVVCAKRYNGHELWTALGVMQERGHTFEVVSTEYTIRDELTLRPNVIERLVYEVPVEEAVEQFDGIMIVSGNMKDTEAYWDDKHVVGLIDAFNSREQPVAAICCSVPTVAVAAEGKQVSFFPLIRSRHRLQDAGAILRSVALTRDKNLVTAEHQMATQMWAIEYSALLEGLDHQYHLEDSGYMPKGMLRKPDPDIERYKKYLEDK